MRAPLLWIIAALATPAFAAPWHADFGIAPRAVVNGSEPAPATPLARSAALILSLQNGESCSGTLIAPELVVTAGHCVTRNHSNEKVLPSSLIVDFSPYYNGTDPLPRRSSIRVRDFRLHPAYDNKQIEAEMAPHDVALIRLVTPAPAGYEPARFLPRGLSLAVGDSVTVGGFGDQDFKETTPDYRLLTFDFHVKEIPASTTLVILAAARDGGIASGDSGGPAWVNKNGELYFWGAASSSEEEGMAEADYENLTAYREWLEQAAASMGYTLSLP